METLILKASKRDVLGKKTRFLRRQGITPVHLFGNSIDSLALQCDTAELRHILARAGKTRPVNLEIDGDKQPKTVFIREVQRSTVKKQPVHVDFYQVRKGEKIKIDVPIILVGEAPALKTKGRMLAHGITTLSIECLPESIPAQIEVDVTSLADVEDAIHVSDIHLDPGITVHEDPEQLVVKVSEALVKEVEEEVAAPAAEVAAEAEAGAEAGAEAPAEAKAEKTAG